MVHYSLSHPHLERHLKELTENATKYCAKQQTNPNPDLYDDELWDLAKGQCTHSREPKASLTPRLPGSLSTISSMLIIFIILCRSSTKLSSIYHRIMFGLSISDILFSAAIGLSTLPMPAPGTNFWADTNRIGGTRIGNTQTCTAQGFFFHYGLASIVCYNVSLCFYYLCAIGFKMKQENMQRYVEPFLHLVPAAVAIWLSVPHLFTQGYNTGFHPWCMVIPEPNFCQDNDKYECERGASEDEFLVLDRRMVMFVLSLSLCALSLALTCYKVFQYERILVIAQRRGNIMIRQTIRHGGADHPTEGRLLSIQGESGDFYVEGNIMERIEVSHKITRVILFQSFLYVASYFATLFFTVLNVSLGTKKQTKNNYYRELTMLPLQGMFTFIIFIFHKVYNMKRVDPSLSVCKALWNIFVRGDADDSFLMSRMYLASLGNATREQYALRYYNDQDDEESIVHMDGEREGVEEHDEEEEKHSESESRKKEYTSVTSSGTKKDPSGEISDFPSSFLSIDSNILSMQTPSLLSGNLSGFDEVAIERSTP